MQTLPYLVSGRASNLRFSQGTPAGALTAPLTSGP